MFRDEVGRAGIGVAINQGKWPMAWMNRQFLLRGSTWLFLKSQGPQRGWDFRNSLNDKRHMAWRREKEGFPGMLCCLGAGSGAGRS